METWYGVDRWSTNILTIEVVKTSAQYRLVGVIARCKSTIRDSSAELEQVMNRRER